MSLQRSYPRISRHGLTQVYSPPSGTEAIAHIIFVHGLFGNPEKTWTGHLRPSNSPELLTQDENSTAEASNEHSTGHKNSKDREIFWPAVLLPQVVQNTQISTWGYDADIDDLWSSASQNTVSQHAASLLSDVADMIESSNPILPIIFVVHSLGGIIVKAAMNQSAETRGTRLKIMVTHVAGILFLGTPHRGSKSASIGKMAYQITTIASRKPNRKLLRSLEKNSDTLEQVGNSFLQTLEGYPDIQIYSFREEKETRKFWLFRTIVVLPDSARIGLSKEESSSIPTNHSDMTKFSALDDIGFKRVSAQLRRWVQAPTRNNDEGFDLEFKDLVSSLQDPATSARIRAVSPYHAKTFQWLYDRQIVTFSNWLQDPSPDYKPIYWIQGLPGSGKSTLMKFAMYDPRTVDLLNSEGETVPRYIIAGYFFHDRGSTIQKSITGMFQELLHSILLQAPRLRIFVQPIYKRLVEAQKSKTPKWDVESLQSAFEAITQQREVTARLCIFLDALDEHLGDNEQLASLVSHLVSHMNKDQVKIKICLASRPWDSFANKFGSGKYPALKIQKHTFGDILAYASSILYDASPIDPDEEAPTKTFSARLDALAAQIAKQAHGVFIWVRIVVQEIANGVRCRTPHFVLVETLAQMPTELKDLYEHTLERIETNHAEEAFVMLQIALCALSPLPLTTFVNVTSYTLWGKYSASGEESIDDMTRRVISRSGGLLEPAFDLSSLSDLPPMPEISVQFIHQTVKEYIQNRTDNFGLRRSNTGGNGFQYILRSAVACWERWANQIGLQIFEYAIRAKNAGTPIPIFNACFLSFIAEQEDRFGTRLDWWLQRNENVPAIGFYIHDIFPVLDRGYNTPRLKLQCLLFMAGLPILALDGRKNIVYFDNYVGNNYYNSPPPYVFVCMASIGPKITSTQIPREILLKAIVGPNSDHKCLIPVTFMSKFGVSGLEIVLDALAVLIISKGKYQQNENERISAMRFFLQHGANPNCALVRNLWTADDLGGIGSTQSELTFVFLKMFAPNTFLQVIKQESAEVIRLFGDHGAKVPADMAEPLMTFWKRFPRPSDVLEEVQRIIRITRAIESGAMGDMSNSVLDIYKPDSPISGVASAVVFCSLMGMAYGASGVTVKRITARERWHRAVRKVSAMRVRGQL